MLMSPYSTVWGFGDLPVLIKRIEIDSLRSPKETEYLLRTAHIPLERRGVHGTRRFSRTVWAAGATLRS